MFYLALIHVNIQEYPDRRREETWTRLIEANSVELAKLKVDNYLKGMSDQYGTSYWGSAEIHETIT